MNAVTSSGVGGRPVMSKCSLRSRVLGLVGLARVRPLRLRFFATRESMVS